MLLHSLKDAIRLYDIGIGSYIIVSCAYISVFSEQVIAFDVKDLREDSMGMENLEDVG